ncbi:MAG: caspase family protein [Edaphobacter sp.]
MRKALIVGIDRYDYISGLTGCVHDANEVNAVLERHADGSVNFPAPRLLIGDAGNSVTRKDLKDAAKELFSHEGEIALFYFAGHGYTEDTGGYLCTTDVENGDDGLAFSELLSMAGQSKAKNKIIILDSCHSGGIGIRAAAPNLVEVHTGMTILTASAANQYAMEVPGGGAGVFTTLLVDALHGAAANLMGEVTPGSVYAHIDQSLGPWAQRPVFRTNVDQFVSLRKASAPISLSDLQAITTFFPTAGFEFKLDPAFEPERSPPSSLPPPDPAKTAAFSVLQRYVKVNLVRPVDAPHMWHAAMQNKSCKLTVLGEHYRRLVEDKLI